MSKVILSIIIIATYTGSWSGPCACQRALEDDLPHGANEVIEYGEKVVKSIQGQVLYRYNDEATDDVVVEIYNLNEADKSLSPREIALRRERRTACITTKDGSFCFPDLPSGRYVLRAGTRNSMAGMNEVFMKVTVDRRWWSKWFRTDKRIKLELTIGA